MCFFFFALFVTVLLRLLLLFRLSCFIVSVCVCMVRVGGEFCNVMVVSAFVQRMHMCRGRAAAHIELMIIF